MADHVKVFSEIEKKASISYPVLVPNPKGLESAVILLEIVVKGHIHKHLTLV